jgi:hypothetical protein
LSAEASSFSPQEKISRPVSVGTIVLLIGAPQKEL